MSRRLNWERATLMERAKSSNAGRPATHKQIAYLRILDPTVSEETLYTLGRSRATEFIERLLRVK